MTLTSDEIRDRLEERWRRSGYDALLPVERDFILVWWLEAEASNGSLHQYFANSTGDAAIDTLAALDRIGAPRAAIVLRDAMKLFGDGPYPIDRAERNAILNSLHERDDDGNETFDRLTDRLLDESEDVGTLALDRVGDAYTNGQVPQDTASGSQFIRWVAIILICLLTISLIGMILIATTGG